MSDPDLRQSERFARAYEALRRSILLSPARDTLLDLEPRGEPRPRVRLVDEVPEEVHRALTGGASLELVPLPDPDEALPEEQAEAFRAELEHARNHDLEYRTRLGALAGLGDGEEFERVRLDRWLRDRVREDLGLRPRPDTRPFDGPAFAKSKGIDPGLDLPVQPFKFSHQDKRLQTLLLRDELEAALDRVARAAAHDEAATADAGLHLAIGALEWQQAGGEPRLAPLLLLPVRLERRPTRGGPVHALSSAAQAAETNPSLRVHLRDEWDVALPLFEPDEAGDPSIERYFEEVRAAVAGLPRWQIRRRLVLGAFGDLRAVVFDDLDPAAWSPHPSANRLVRAILAGFGDGPAARREPEPDDGTRPQPLLVHEADPFQRAAVADAAAGADVVVDAAPGTGATQTVADIVADAVAAGRSVLVVGHARAALEAVAERLGAAGLGEACLALHGDGIDARRLVEDLKRRFYMPPETPRLAPAPDRAAADAARRALAGYAAALHARAGEGPTPFEAMWHSIRHRGEFAAIPADLREVPLPDDLTADAAAVERGVALIEDLLVRERPEPPADSPWRDLVARLAPDELDRLPAMLAEAREAARGAAAVVAEAAALGVPADALATLPDRLAALAMEPPAGLDGLAALAALDTGRVREAMAQRRALDDLAAELAEAPLLAGLGEAELAAALEAAAAVWPPERRDAPLSQVRAEAASFVAFADTVSETVAAFLPAADLLGLPPTATAADLEPVAVAARAVASLPADIRAMLSHPWPGDPADLAAWGEALDALVRNDAEWRGLVPAYGAGMVVSVTALREAADFLRRAGPGRWNSMIGGGGIKAARALVARLMLPETPGTPDLLEGWAAHLDAMAAFLTGPARRIAGAHWNALATPFARLADAAVVRARLAAALGPDLAARVCALPVPRLESLAALADAGAAFVRFAAARPDVLGPRPVRDVLAALAGIRGGARAFLDRLPDGPAVELPLPVADLARLGPVERRRRALAAEVPRDAAWALVAEAVDPDGFAPLCAWIDAVRAAGLPAAVEGALLTPEAPVHLVRLRGLADIAADLVAAGEAAAAALARVGLAEAGAGPPEVEACASTLLARRDDVPLLVAHADGQRRLAETGLGAFLERTGAAGVPAADLPALFRVLATERRAGRLRAALPGGTATTGDDLDGHLRTLAEQDAAKCAADRHIVRQKLLLAKPSPGSAAGPKRQWTEAVLLRNEFVKMDGSGRRFTPVREQLRRAPQTLRAFKPCLLMSPGGVARLLPRDTRFDLVVFDGAGRAGPAAAFGAALRGRQMVVVGDRRDLPPAEALPAPAADPAPDDPAAGERVSLLDLCARGLAPARVLRLRHGARGDGLAAFADRAVDGGGLLTVPSPARGGPALDLVRVEGTASRGVNPAEAQRVAEEAVAFMVRFAEALPERTPTLGIVTPERAQRDLIADEIRRLAAGNEAVERYREKLGRRAPVVETLDAAPGEAADHVFASLTYGRQPGEGMVVRALGVFARRDGDRRVALLATRARTRLTLFCSMGAADLGPDPAAPRGVRLLTELLTAAEQGVVPAAPDPDGPLAATVAAALAARRVAVEVDAGASAARIDLAVPSEDGRRWRAAVLGDRRRLADGLDYDAAFDAALRRRGWPLLRVWTVDWFDDPAAAAERLATALPGLPGARPGRAEAPYRVAGALARDEEAAPLADREEPVSPGQAARLVEGDPGLLALFSLRAGAREPAARPPAAGEPRIALGRAQARRVLELFRARRIDAELSRCEPRRSILRPELVEALLDLRPADAADAARRLPPHLLRSVDARQLRYLPDVCAILARLRRDERH